MDCAPLSFTRGCDCCLSVQRKWDSLHENCGKEDSNIPPVCSTCFKHVWINPYFSCTVISPFVPLLPATPPPPPKKKKVATRKQKRQQQQICKKGPAGSLACLAVGIFSFVLSFCISFFFFYFFFLSPLTLIFEHLTTRGVQHAH